MKRFNGNNLYTEKEDCGKVKNPPVEAWYYSHTTFSSPTKNQTYSVVSKTEANILIHQLNKYIYSTYNKIIKYNLEND